MNEKKTLNTRVLYTAKTHTIGGRDGGSSISSDGHLSIRLSSPGKSQEGTNPEQLFAAGWSACYLSALQLVAAQRKVHFPKNASIDAEVDLVLTGDHYSLQARLHVKLPGLSNDTAQELVAAAHDTCPYSKATRGNIGVETIVYTE